MAAAVVHEFATLADRSNSLGPYALGFTPTAGNVLIAFIFQRNGGTFTDPAGYTLIAQNVGASGFDDTVVAWIRESDGTETSFGVPSNSGGGSGSDGTNIVVLEMSGLLSTGLDADTSTGTGTALTSGAVSAAARSAVFGAWAQAADTSRTFTPGTGYTNQESGSQAGSFHPGYLVEWKVAATTTTYAPDATSSASATWRSISFSIPAIPLPPGVYVDWDDDGFTADDEVTDDVAAIRFQQGASAEITGGAQPGSATIELVNPSSDIYNPLNSGGALYGKILDGRPVWGGIADDGTFTGTGSNGLFGGRLGDITPKPQAGLGRPLFVTLACEDALGWYGRTPGRVADGLFRSQATFRGLILTAVGETRTDLAHETMTMPISSWDGDAGPGLEALNKANGTRHFIRPGADPDAWYQYATVNRQHRLDGTTDASLDAGSDHVTGTDGWRLSASTVINQQKATTVPITFTSGTVTVWEAPTLPIGVTTAKPYETWVEFDDFVQGAVADVNYTGTAPTVTLTPFGTSAKLSITSAGTTTITALSIEGSLLRRGVAESVVEDNTPSQAGSRGVRAGSEISGELVGVKAAAQGIAAHVVWRYGDPQYRPTLTVENWFPDMFQVEMFDVLAITIDGLSMTARHFEVVGRAGEIRIASSAVQSASMTYVLQECRVQSDPGWFVLDTSELNDTDQLAY